MAGWGSEVFSAYNHWWIIPLIATHLGAIIGAGLYFLLGNYQQVRPVMDLRFLHPIIISVALLELFPKLVFTGLQILQSQHPAVSLKRFHQHGA